MSGIITGEAVVLELRPASFAARSLGAAIDAAVLVAVALGLFLTVSAVPELFDQAAGRAFVLVTVVAVLIGVPVTVETLSRGKSLGKLAMGLRVVRDDGGSIRFRHALVRGLLGFFEIYLMFGSVAFLASLFNARSKRLGDMLAGTYAIRDRAPKIQPLLVTTPPALAPWAQLADIGRLPDPLARRMTTFLRQRGQMSPASRHALGLSLAEEAAGYVAPLPPAGTAAEAFLEALAAERRERDFHRLAAEQERAQALARRLRPGSGRAWEG